jgi:uncharacterized protein YxjI
MEIDINQQKISIGDKYKIFVDGEQTHYASRKLFSLLPVVQLYEGQNERPRMTINKRMAFFKAKYDITRSDNQVLEFRTQSFWKPQYQCLVGPDNYVLYGHRGRKVSIYENDRQIAWWDKQAVSWFAGDNYKLICDKSADIELLIAFCLVVDNFASDDHDGNTINIDLGNLFQARKFDRDWQPK